ncbi:MAG: hypothetical protein Q8N35_11380 [Methylococcaceae bacterium]|nr:hypothetical protein [Methylococcaceae bacterium]MDZ4156604.1 hypothetical protein [Methylococcales bacterium]MDP2394754.1 hypothetical protein [Methylococcaceae bacterium]MDP3020176.1 hypothetical protein [Methylococcaceae bacterium]MDP3390716.1 hypothetical protein [Methylococcaceae bacterium]
MSLQERYIARLESLPQQEREPQGYSWFHRNRQLGWLDQNKKQKALLLQKAKCPLLQFGLLRLPFL